MKIRRKPETSLITGFLAIAFSGTAMAASPAGYAAVIGTGPGVGPYTLNRIEVTRTYTPSNISGAISPGMQTLPPSTPLQFQLGWNYNWPDPVTGPNANKFVVQYNISPPDQVLLPCDTCQNGASIHSQSTLNGSMSPTINSSGFGIDRDHTYAISGFAGTQSQSLCCNPDIMANGNPIINFNNTFDVPPVLNGEIRLPIIGMMNFGQDQGIATLEIDLIYDPGPAACPSSSYSVHLPTQFPDATGGSFTVGVTAPSGCTWGTTVQYSINQGGSLVVSGSGNGSGNGSVTLTETANISAIYLSRAVNIAGQLVAITQPPSAGNSGGGTYALNRVEVTRTYSNGIGGPGSNPIQPGKQTFSANQLVLAYQAGWDFFWGTNSVNRNRFVAALNFDNVPPSVTPGAAYPNYLGAYTPWVDMHGDWVASGYGINRFHTLSTSGAASAISPGPNSGGTGLLPCQTATDNPDGTGDLGCNSNGSDAYVPRGQVPQPDGNKEVRLVVFGMVDFADAGNATIEVDLVYSQAGSQHPAFFAGEVGLGGSVYYLQFPGAGTLFGYYNYQAFPWLYHYDMGFEYFVDAGGGNGAAYLYDALSGHWFYTSPGLFPYLYDFTLKSWLYYFSDSKNAGHYTTNPRYFSNLTTGKIITM